MVKNHNNFDKKFKKPLYSFQQSLNQLDKFITLEEEVVD